MIEAKTKLDTLDVYDWMDNHWNLYSSQVYEGKLLRFWVNCQGKYRVVYGNETLYEGSQMTHAIAAWDTA